LGIKIRVNTCKSEKKAKKNEEKKKKSAECSRVIAGTHSHFSWPPVVLSEHRHDAGYQNSTNKKGVGENGDGDDE
jgi:hypothetical protein